MFHVGCLTACFTVMSRISSMLRSRNGPPLQVKVIFSMCSTRLKSKHCQIALCSLSTGSRVAPLAATSCMNRLPAQTSTSLLANATMRPCRTAASVDARPAAPTMPAITQSAGRSAASTSASGPHPTSIPDPDSASFSVSYSAGSATAANRAFNCRACSAKAAALRFAVRASTVNSSRLRSSRSTVLRPIEPVEPSTETRRGCAGALCVRFNAVTAMSARCRRQSRSTMPPWE